MKIKINVKNSSVDFRGQEIDLDRYGVYLVTGPNGIGKTTIIKDLVFSKKFNDGNQNHFAYIEQDPEKYDIRVIDYLKRFNSDVDTSLMNVLLQKFDLSHLNMKSSLMIVSGGELVKLNIIAGLIKETDFIFLDEPTNNLDDRSVEVFKETISKLAKGKVIVIVSHDPRITFEHSHTIVVETNRIAVKYSSLYMPLNHSAVKSKPIRYPMGQIVRRHFSKPASIISICLILIYALPILLINHIVFLARYDSDEMVSQDDSILVYYVDCEYGELSQIYAECEGIDVDEKNYYSLIQYSDIPTLAEDSRVEEIYIENTKSWDELNDKINQRLLFSSSVVVSIPETIRKNYMYQIHPYLTIDYLVEGRYPKDNQNEIVLSQLIIDNIYPGKEINDCVLFEGVEYRIVGIHYLDLYLVSYSGSSDYFYKYEPETYEHFVTEQINHKINLDTPTSYIYRPSNLIIKTENGEEKEFLTQLFAEYPANNYRSYSYDKDMADFRNENLIMRVSIVNIIAGILIGGLFILVNRKRCSLYNVEAESIDNYYLSKPLTSRILSTSELTLNIILYVAFIIASKSFATYDVESVISSLGFGVLIAVASIPHIIILFKKHD